jgi:hypothetical protein
MRKTACSSRAQSKTSTWRAGRHIPAHKSGQDRTPQNILIFGTALGWQTPLNPPRCITPHPRMATQIMGESGLRNSKTGAV